MAFSLQEALEQIRSDKIKDRQSGLEALEHIFSDSNNVVNLDPKQDGKAWLKVFQALFACVLAEKAACIRKGSFLDAQPVSLARLQRAAQMLRSLVDKAAPLLTRKVVKALITHILQMINHRGTLLRPVAPAYISALCAVLSHQHHVDHLDPEDWRAAACLCFDMLLGRDLDSPAGGSDPTAWLASLPSSPTLTAHQRGLSLEDTVTAECLRHLLASTVAPLLGSNGHGLSLLADYTRFFLTFPGESSAHLPAMTGLVALVEHLELNHPYSVLLASLALRSSIIALWKTKNHLLKKRTLLFLRIVSPLLASFAGGQSEIAPSQDGASGQAIRANATMFLHEVYDLLLHDHDTRWALEPIKMDALVFYWPAQRRFNPQQHQSALSNAAFGLGPMSKEQDSLAWCRIGLQVEILDALITSESARQGNGASAPLTVRQDEQEEPPSSTAASQRSVLHPRPSNAKRGADTTSSSPQKRRRKSPFDAQLNQPERTHMEQLLDTVFNAASTPIVGAGTRLGALQLLVFVLLTRPNLIEPSMLLEARQRLLTLAADPDPLLVSWSLVGLGAAVLISDRSGAADAEIGHPSARASLHHWGIAVRKLELPETCRSAAFLLNAMLSRAALPDSVLRPDITRLVAEVDLQGPPFLCDTVCHLMTLLLQRTTSDRTFLHLDARRKIGAWFANSYTPAEAPRSSTQSAAGRSMQLFTPYHDLLRLVGCVIAERALESSAPQSVAAHNDEVATLLSRLARLQSLRELTLCNKCTQLEVDINTVSERVTHARPPLLSMEDFERLAAILEKKVGICLDLLDSRNSEDVPVVTHDRAVSMIHAAMLAVDVWSKVTMSNSSQNPTRVKRACQVIVKIVDLASSSEGTLARPLDLALQQLRRFAPFENDVAADNAASNNLLAVPGSASGVAPGPQLAKPQDRPVFVADPDDFSKRIWTAIQEAGMLETVLSSCNTVLERVVFDHKDGDNGPASLTASSLLDAFDDMTESASPNALHEKHSNCIGSIESTDAIVSTFVRLLVGVPRILSTNADSRRDELVLSLYFDCPVDSMIALAPVLFDLLRKGKFWMSQRDLVDALDRIGSELLASYQFARHPAARLAAIRAVKAVLPLLLEDFDEQSDLFDKVQKLAVFFADQIGRVKWPTPWGVQLDCASFLAECLRQDGEGRLSRSGSARASGFTPRKSLLCINADADIRVRGLGSPMAANVFDTVISEQGQTSDLYNEFRDSLPSDSSIPQHILTRALSLANVAIVNSAVRQSALFHLLEIVLATDMFPITVQHLFAQIAARLGFPDASSCYQAFAGQMTWGMATNNYDPLQVPWKVVGFTSKRECLDATFAASGSMLLAAQTQQGKTQFDALVQLTKRTHRQGLQECMPFLTAAYLGFAVEATQQQERPDLASIGTRALHELTQLGFSDSAEHEELRRMISGADDLVVTTLLTLYFEPAATLAESRRSSLARLTQLDAKAGKALSSLTPTTASSALVLHEPSRPFFASAVVAEALLALPNLGIEPFSQNVVYNVLRHVVHRIATSRFHNEQLRLCAALRIYLAMCGDSFWADQLNVRILVQSVELLLDQRLLHDDFGPILMYACSHSSLAQHKPDILVSCIATWADKTVKQLTESPKAGEWLFEAARAVAKASPIATSSTILLWPVKSTSTEHAAIEGLIDIDTVAFAMQACPRLSLRLPSMLRIRHVLRRTNRSQLETFCLRSGWKLLERMASSHGTISSCTEGESPSDVVSDIYACISSVDDSVLMQRERASTEHGHKQGQTASETYLAAADTSQACSLSAAAVLKVHELTQTLPLEPSYQAYETLRSIVAVVQDPFMDTLPTVSRGEIDRIRPSISALTTRAAALQPESLPEQALLESSTSSELWIRRITAIMCSIIASFPRKDFFRPIGQFVSTNKEAAEALFHVLLLCFTTVDMDTNVATSSAGGRRRTSGRRSDFQDQAASLQQYRAAMATHFDHILTAQTADPKCHSIIVNALLAVRSNRPVQEEPDKVCFWFQVDTDLLAKCCIACGLYSAAIFFVEHGDREADESQVSYAPHMKGRAELLHQAYMNIDDPDAFYGITDGDVRELLLKRLHHEGQWLRAFQYHAAAYEASTSDGESATAQAGALGESLSQLGFQRLVHGVSTASASPSSVGLHLAPGNGVVSTTWDLPTDSSLLLAGGDGVDSMLRTLRQVNNEQDVDKPLSLAIQSQLQRLCSVPAESIANMRKIQGDLLSLGQIKEWRKASSSLGSEEAVMHLKSVWTRADVGDQFERAEAILNTQQSLLQIARQRLQSTQIGDVLDGPAEEIARVERLLLVRLSQQAREHKKLQKAINATARAEKIELLLGDGANLAREEFAAVLWDQKEHSPAMQLLSQIVDDLAITTQASMQQRRRGARLLALLAQWRATARSQHPREIDRNLFEPALKMVATSTPSDTSKGAEATMEQSDISYRWARFAEEHHRGSDMAEVRRLRLYIQRRAEEIALNQHKYERTSSKTDRGKLLQFQRQAEKIIRQDQTRLTELEASRTHFLRRSVVMYARALSSSDAHDDAVARLISLWFENAEDAELNRLLTNCLASVPSRKFVALMHQLSARLTEVQDQSEPVALFQSNLNQLLLRMCQDHPFHCLYAIFALIKTGADAKAASHRTGPRSSIGASENAVTSLSPPVLRSTAAEKIWNHVKRQTSHGKRIRIFEELCLAYVEWAEFDLASRPDRYFQSSGAIKKGALRMPPSGELRLVRMRDLDVPVATARLEIDPTCKYEKVISIVRYSDSFTTAGGIHLPKISECIGSDGKRYKQLFKRDDDLRQDAVMQQVFRMVNDLLKSDRRTRERKLAIRIYTVLPLGPQCGMLEFVTNTVPLGELLIGLHDKYRSNDITPTQARTKMRDAQSLPAEAKLEAFLDVCEQMRPAFRYFFSDAQRMPRDWYETRLRYTRSVSTNSIVGHVLGLGDRHVSNILLDKESGELVHIDFGVAFDQGKLLPIPELVPFRLTRDLVDGMGMHGVEGTFRRCCEETLRVLRAHQDVIKTVLEVFRHDPLFAWTSNPIKVLRAQEDEESSLPALSLERSGSTSRTGRSTPAPTPAAVQGRGAVSRSTTPYAAPTDAAEAVGTDTAELSADRAVTSVMSKLSSSLSIEYTVNDLIQQATDAGNLSAIFHGWQAAL
ncbi:potential phosphatidylinositol kinase [Pseudozyma hubeiensis SY62]|uniref:Serine/threonine-protein kinase TEL1 n=1 Tax=Pseudozyma hubeiensis (strain SY62) TaxID=1305764 RepID=R9P9V8_PSEHS|nr:potential phosphatidylinositol kinase [Pseudozyma hubeiensis SY62]GAC98161.1 potential phosphatidylinositol kinase [Pseudozyma hubeiensis SY62]